MQRSSRFSPEPRNRQFAAAVVFPKRMHFAEDAARAESVVPYEVLAALRSPRRFILEENNRLSVCVNGREPEAVSGDITRACAWFARERLPDFKARALELHQSLKAGLADESAGSLADETTRSLSAFASVRLKERQQFAQLATEVLRPLAAYSRVAVAFAAVVAPHDTRLPAWVGVHISAALSGRVLERTHSGGAWFAALFKDILDPAYRSQPRSADNVQHSQEQAALRVAAAMCGALTRRRLRTDLERQASRDVAAAGVEALKQVPADACFHINGQHGKVEVTTQQQLQSRLVALRG